MIRNVLMLLFCCCACVFTTAQQMQSHAEYTAVSSDNISPRELAEQLTAGQRSEYDKVRSIFDWITENIGYRSLQYSRRNSNPVVIDEDTSAILKPLNERVAEIVLRNRLAVCDGYARLFKTLCDHADIRAEIVTGFVRNSNRSSARFQTNHSWNAVMIEGKWYLVDATWGSGYVNYSGQFIRQYDRHFFLADPVDMLQTHYPENPFWTLTDKHYRPWEFKSQPLKYFTWHGAYIGRYSPRSGIIDVHPGTSVEIMLETKEQKKDLLFTTDPFAFLTPFSATWYQRNFVVDGNKISGSWMPGHDKAEWLYVVFNGEVIMRYQLRYNSF
jgi:hypothetical protein